MRFGWPHPVPKSASSLMFDGPPNRFPASLCECLTKSKMSLQLTSLGLCEFGEGAEVFSYVFGIKP